ncbi:hypothetical protein JCM9743_07060 [Natrinema sp. JCM 9743]
MLTLTEECSTHIATAVTNGYGLATLYERIVRTMTETGGSLHTVFVIESVSLSSSVMVSLTCVPLGIFFFDTV